MIHILKNKNLLFLFILTGLKFFLLIMPVITLFFQEHGLTLAQVMFLQVTFAITIVILEIPSWYLADRFKRKYSINIWLFLGFLGFFFYLLFPSFWWFFAWQIAMGLWTAFTSWADSAYLYDELILEWKQKDYQKIEWQFMSIKNFSESAAAFLGWFIAAISFEYLLTVQTAAFFSAFVLSLFLKEHPRNKKQESPLKLKEVWTFLTSENKTIKYYALFAWIIWTSTLMFTWMCQPYWKELWLPLEYFWIVWWTVNLLVGVAALFAHYFWKRFSLKQNLIFFAICSWVFYILLYFIDNLYLALFVSSFFWIFRWINWPIMKDYINREVSSKMRATVLSIKSLAFRGVFSVLSPWIWYIADIYTLQTAFLMAGVILITLSWIVLCLLMQTNKH